MQNFGLSRHKTSTDFATLPVGIQKERQRHLAKEI